MAFGIGDSLSVTVRAATGDFVRSVNRAQETLQDFRRTAATTAGTLTALGGAATTSSIGMRSVAVVTVGTLIPALGALSTVLVPITGTFAALAGAAAALSGAFGLVIGSGILAFGEERAAQNEQELEQVQARIEQLETLQEEQGKLSQERQDELQQLKDREQSLEDQTNALGAFAGALSETRDELVPIIADFGEQFIPLIRDALATFPALVERVLDSVGSLDQFRQALRDFGNFAFEVIPQVAAFFADLARNSLDDLRNLADWLVSVGPGAVEEFRIATQFLEDEWADLGDALGDVLPKLNRVGVTVGEVVIPAITRGVRGVENIADAFRSLDREMQGVVTRITLAAPIVTSIVGLLFSLTGPLGVLVGAVVSFALAWDRNFMGIRDTTQQTLGPVISFINDLASTLSQHRPAIRSAINAIDQAFGAFMEGFDMQNVLQSVNALADTILREWQKSLPQTIELLRNFSSVLTENQDDIAVIGRAASTIIGGIIDLLGILVEIGGFALRNAYIPVLNLIISLFDSAINRVANMIRLFEAVQSGDFGAALGFAEDVALGEGTDVPSIGETAMFASQGAMAAPQVAGAAVQSQQSPTQAAASQQLEIVLDERTDVVEGRIEQGAQDVITSIERKTKRNSGSSPSP